MPFQSEAQRRFLWLKHPEIAKRWAQEYPDQGKRLLHKSGQDKVTEALLKAKHG